jgi:DNA-directed RNA polymerase sigma subunit (sigma70/sigma32)
VAVPANRNNVSSVEVYVVRNATITEMEMEAKEIERFISKLDNAISSLLPNEQSVLLSRYFTKDGSVKEFKNVAVECGYSEEWCIKLNHKALENIDAFLSGYKIEWQTLQ